MGAPITITPVTRPVPSGTAFTLSAVGRDELARARSGRFDDTAHLAAQQRLGDAAVLKTRNAQSIAAMDQMNALVDGPVELICNESAENDGVSRLVN